MFAQATCKTLDWIFKLGIYIGATPFQWNSETKTLQVCSMKVQEQQRQLLWFYFITFILSCRVGILYSRFAISLFVCSAADIIFQTIFVLCYSVPLLFQLNTLIYCHEVVNVINQILRMDEMFTRRGVNSKSTKISDPTALILNSFAILAVSNATPFITVIYSIGPSFPLYNNNFYLISSENSLILQTVLIIPELLIYIYLWHTLFLYFGFTIAIFVCTQFWLNQLKFDSSDNCIIGLGFGLGKPKREIIKTFRCIQLIIISYNRSVERLAMTGNKIFGFIAIVCCWFGFVKFYNQFSAVALMILPTYAGTSFAIAFIAYPAAANFQISSKDVQNSWLQQWKKIGLPKREIIKFIDSCAPLKINVSDLYSMRPTTFLVYLNAIIIYTMTVVTCLS